MKFSKIIQIALVLSNVLFTTALYIIGSIYLGIYLDRWLKTDFLFTVILSILGLILSFYSIIKTVMRLNK